ncbi:hypothetical protein GCM10018987_19340 [Streptomyces cremeus]
MPAAWTRAPEPDRGFMTYADLVLDLTLAFHHTAQDDRDQAATALARLRETTRDGDCAHYRTPAHFMAGPPPKTPPQRTGPTAPSTYGIDGAPRPHPAHAPARPALMTTGSGAPPVRVDGT